MAKAQLGGEDAIFNTTASRLKSAQYKRAVLHYYVHHPGLAARRFFDLYPLFWWRMADYGIMLADVFVIEPHHAGLVDLAARGFHEKQHVETDLPTYGAPVTRAAAFGTISLAPLDAAAIVMLHGVFPVLALLDVWRRWRRRPALLPPGAWIVAMTCLYGAFVSNAVDAGETMR